MNVDILVHQKMESDIRKMLKNIMGVLLLNLFLGSAIIFNSTEANEKSEIVHLNLSQVSSQGNILEDGARGGFEYSTKKGKFVFNGHGLVAGLNYTLIWFFNTSPDGSFVCLGDALTDIGGNINIKGTRLSLTDTASPYLSLWLVLSEDITCGESLNNWNLNYYLVANQPAFNYYFYDKKNSHSIYKKQLELLFKRQFEKFDLGLASEFIRWIVSCTNCGLVNNEEEKAAWEAEKERVDKELECASCKVQLLRDVVFEMACLHNCTLNPETCSCETVNPNKCDEICN